LALARKQSARMEDINKLLRAGSKDKALRLVGLALRDSPRQLAEDQGLTVWALSAYCLARKDTKGRVIGYGYAPLTEIER